MCRAQAGEGPSPLPVLEALLAELLDHMRKGTGGVVYEAVIQLAEEQLKTFKACGKQPVLQWMR